ncbi:OmpA domain protein [Rhodovulum sp. P5]|uniref:OmpA family protein n=1 Tax=Rhodovulum sp. P5 TaxID=1564506 RepID=UPI0009C35924|nr:OmpA family protein [Rhodovulum sp. P5]ARE40246.1 OmpA domain protein [Rhodovulum sp. P5]
MRRLLTSLLAPVTIAVAAGLCVLAALVAVDEIERRTAAAVHAALSDADHSWVAVRSDGMLVHLAGTAPDEAARFHALSAAGQVIDPANLIDDMQVTAATGIEPPEFRVELLRNDAGISVIGLVPTTTDRAALIKTLDRVAPGRDVTDMLESADYSVPDGWGAALAFGIDALKGLERAKLSVTASQIAVTAVADSREDKARIEQSLRETVPAGVDLALDISAPRPVIAPFTLRFLMDRDGARFDACAADTEAAAARILATARQAGMVGKGECVVALGVPAPSWGKAVEHGISAVASFGGGSVTFSDADVTLVAPPGTDPRLFDRVAGDLEAALPDIFALHAVLPDPVKVDGSGNDTGPKEFIATLSPEGLLQLRGRVPDKLVREAVESYARSRFGRDDIYSALRIDDKLPDGWPLRVLSGLEALSQLRNGAVIVQTDYLRVNGLTLDETARARVARILSDRLGDAQNYDLEIAYREPTRAEERVLPSPEDCVAEIQGILSENKITFAPGSTEIEGDAVRIVDRIADVLRLCPDARIEISGHTDSQGREQMNLALSQSRAEAVLNGLMARRVLTGNLTAKGYGEAQPIAPNDTEDGREANRRIEFRLIVPPGQDAAEETEDTPEATDETDDVTDTPAEETGETDGQD